MTVNVCPAIVTVPRRSASVLAAIASCTVPFPEPLLPDVRPIHPALLDAFHAQPAGAVTATDADPPLVPTFWLDGEIAYEQPPACVTVKVCPPATIVPVR
jgi:hypothetical protein